MDKKKEILKESIVESINNYSSHRANIKNIYLKLKNNKKYENNILKYYNPEKDENFLKFSFLLFFQHNKWINPYNLIIFPFEDHFRLIKNESNERIEYLIINMIDSRKIEKLFIYWHFYLLSRFEEKLELNSDNNTNNVQNNLSYLFNNIKNILFQTHNKLLNIFLNKKISIEEIFTFLYIYLFFIEYYTKTIKHEKQLKIINSILFKLLFDLLEKITIIILSFNNSIEEDKNNMKILFKFLHELKINSLILNDYNIITILDNNIIQTFIENIIIHINPKKMENIFPNFSGKLADFYSEFVKFRFNKGKIFDFLINNTKNSLINLKYFIEKKEKILNDVFIQNFQCDLIQKIYIEEYKKLEHPNFNSFLFNGNNSKMSFLLKKLSLNDNIIIFSFQIKSNINENDLFNERQPLFCFYNYKKELKFKLFLKKIDSDKNNETNNIDIKNKKKLFTLNIIINNNLNEDKTLLELDSINCNITYYICIHLNHLFIKCYLYSSKINSKLLKASREIMADFAEDEILLNIGYDEYYNKKEYFSGYIGDFFIIRLINKNKIDYSNNINIIQNILLLKDFYRYIIFYLKLDNKLESQTEYNLDYIFFHKNKSEIFKVLINLGYIRYNSKNNYEIILCLSPGLLKFLNINEKDNINNYSIPKISGLCEKQKEYSFNDINITFVKFDFSRDIFLMKNGFNYFCLQFEYFFQFANYYNLFLEKIQKEESKEKDNDNDLTYLKENIDICIKLIKNAINTILIILSKDIFDLNIINFSTVLKQIFATLLSAMKSLNNISISVNIIDSIFNQINVVFAIVYEKFEEVYNYLNFKKSLIEGNHEINYLLSFRDGLIDFLLTNEFYLKASSNFIELLFHKLILIIESNSVKDIIETNPNIFLKVLNFTSLLSNSFINLDSNIYKTDLKNVKGNSSIINAYLKIIKALIIKKKNKSNDDIFYKQLFIFALRDNKDKPYITFAFLSIIYTLLKDGFFLEESEIVELINYLEENINIKEIKLNSNNEGKEENIEKFKNDFYSLIILILINNIFEKNRKKNMDSFFKIINEFKLNYQLFISITNEMINIFGSNLESKNMAVIKNINNIKDINNKKQKKKSSSSNINITSENFNYSNFYEDIFDFILILFRKIFCKKDEKKDIKDMQKENITNIINFKESLIKDQSGIERIKLELINLIIFIEEMISAQINNDNIQITTIYCLINLIKLFQIITFDKDLINFYKEDKFLLLFKNLLELCCNSKIIYTNYMICPNENSSSSQIFKTIPEIIMEICIKLITSDIIKSATNKKGYKEEVMNNDIIIAFLNVLFLKEKYNKKDKKQKENNNKNRSLFCYNDIYRFLFSRKISNIEGELTKINKDKNLMKYFPKFGKELIIVYKINNILLNKEKTFNYNFITFNIEKIYKFSISIEKTFTFYQELSTFFDNLLTRIIKEHEILFAINRDFFFKGKSSNYNNYNFTKNSIETYLNEKKLDYLKVKDLLDKKYIEKVNVYQLVSSGLCENININENKKKRNKKELNKSYIEQNTKKENFGKKISSLFNIHYSANMQNDILNNSPSLGKEQYKIMNYDSENSINHMNINTSRSSSFISDSGSSSLTNEEYIPQSEGLINNNIAIISPTEKEANINKLSSSVCISSTINQGEKKFTHVKSNSNYSLPNINNKKMNINKNKIDTSSNNSDISIKTNLIEDKDKINNICFFNKLDYMYLFNVKRDLMKNIFSLNFIDTIFYDKTFLDVQKLYIQKYGDKIDDENKKFLNYPTKIKNFSNGLEPPLFVKPFNNFYENKIFPLSHEYFYDYIQKNKQKYKYQYINLFNKEISIPKNEIFSEYKCELIKIDHSLYGSITYSKSSGYLFFKQEDFDIIFNSKKNDIYFDGLFSLSCMKYKEKENVNIVKKYKSNRIVPKKKDILILLSDIEEIVERRFLLMWQGLEIYLKDGRSFFFNLLNESIYEKLKTNLLENDELKPLFHKKDYLTTHKLITRAWEENVISTYEYLLLINKYSSRSFNDPNQYYVFPWLLNKLNNLIYINDNDKNLYEKKRKQSTYSDKDKNKKDNEMNSRDLEIIQSLRDLKYSVSLQTENNRKLSIYRYSDDEDNAFKFHMGTHYSTSPFVFYYLMRQEPYNTLLIKLQNYQKENPNRMFIGLKETIEILESGNDNRELIPEFFSKIEFFLNLNCIFFGYRSNNRLVNNVNINFIKNNNKSQTLISDYVHLNLENKKLLNSYLVSSNINDWIDNIFGVGQLPPKKYRKDCCNIFRKTTYEKETNLIKKIEKYENLLNKKFDANTIRVKIFNKINLIISFGQTPYQVFKEQHPRRLYNSSVNINDLGFNKNYNLGEDHNDDEDYFEDISNRILHPSSKKCFIIHPCIYFEINNNINKIFALSQNEEVVEIKYELYNDSDSDISIIAFQNSIKIPHTKTLEKIKIKGFDYYKYKPKYSFSSFKNIIESDKSNNSSRKNSEISRGSSKINKNYNFNFNKYYKNIFENLNMKKENNEEIYKFMQCRYLDNSFKLFKITKKKNSKKKEKEIIINSYSYICEDFVSSCCTISSNEFLIGLENGKLIRWKINEEVNRIKLYFDKNIQAHKSRINAIEIDERLGLIITCGNDNYVQIRKLYNLELLTPIQINKKYIISIAKVSNNNFLYIICFDKIIKNSVIFGYTLTGIKFAKSERGYYDNINFTRSGNIVTLLNNNEICILKGYNLTKKVINEEDPGFKDFHEVAKNVEGSVWMEFNYFCRKNEESNIIICIKKGKKTEDNSIYYHDFKENKLFE